MRQVLITKNVPKVLTKRITKFLAMLDKEERAMTATNYCKACEKKTHHTVLTGKPGSEMEGKTALMCILCSELVEVEISKEPGTAGSEVADSGSKGSEVEGSGA